MTICKVVDERESVVPDLGASEGCEICSEWGQAGLQFASFCSLVYRGAAISNHRAPEYVGALIEIVSE